MTQQIKVGGVAIGGGAPVTIQSMTNTKTQDAAATVAQIKALAAAGCQIVRLAVPDMAAAEAIEKIRAESPIPIVADIHFDHRLAVAAAERGADKIRINPGNVGGAENVKKVVEACRARHIPIRIGVNGGSLEKPLLQKYGGATAEAMLESALGHARLLEQEDFHDICISLKASDVPTTVRAYRLAAQSTDYPLHIGVTEAGGGDAALIKSAAGLGALLIDGIGDTMRVSLTGDPVREIAAAREILRAAGLRHEGVEIISCPTCGRTEIDLEKIAAGVAEALKDCRRDIRVAVMGCVVNGPGEARSADYGLAGGRGCGVLFRRGETVGKVSEDEMISALVRMINEDR
jgi:(E)-4-hydroxy-3-methylbut-2-enyl-diphosphate synthase